MGSIKTKVTCTATRVRYAWLQRAPRHEANPGTFGVLIYNLGPYTKILSVLNFPLEYLDWQVQYTQFYPQLLLPSLCRLLASLIGQASVEKVKGTPSKVGSSH
jgi:hypothetical protein